jgi:hypothetical protein
LPSTYLRILIGAMHTLAGKHKEGASGRWPDDRLRKLVLMLSSDQPGEVAAAVKAMDRALKLQGRDWKWLAAKLAGNEAPQFRPAPEEPWERREPPPPSEASAHAEPALQAGPWGSPPPQALRSAGLRWFLFQWRLWLSGFYGRGKQMMAGLGALLAFVGLARALGAFGEPGRLVLALIAIGLIFWGGIWLILHTLAFWLRKIRAVVRWFSHSRAYGLGKQRVRAKQKAPPSPAGSS